MTSIRLDFPEPLGPINILRGPRSRLTSEKERSPLIFRLFNAGWSAMPITFSLL